MGRRDVSTWTQLLAARYIFTDKASLSLRGRHYWLRAWYKEFYTLNDYGHLNPTTESTNYDFNNNIFSIDLQFLWNFAPGSEMSVVWKNLIYTYDNSPVASFGKDFSNMLESPQTNSFSIKILYYLDYRYFVKKRCSER